LKVEGRTPREVTEEVEGGKWDSDLEGSAS
jgi:hypothetical protein